MPDEAAKRCLPAGDERRHSARRRALVGATIVFRDGSGTVPCTVRNRAKQGIQLEIPQNQLIPERFFLVTAKDNAVCEAELVWKKGNRIGVATGETIDPSTTDARVLQFLKRPNYGAAEADPDRRVWDDHSRWPI